MFEEGRIFLDDIKKNKFRNVLILIGFPLIMGLIFHFWIKTPLIESVYMGLFVEACIIPVGLGIIYHAVIVRLLIYIFKYVFGKLNVD
ncbi:MAG: hypothetical protein A2161_09830 [Candidatus Schekmanbacteria bacterium RBG_13_48_7]|uniref:Uncharacterized protein n=1 Tax=Candidatus Schekmanbacteria bacterium RBG_13_48_7 TaxID=1817878 RepID=A0A1F7RKW1_9BACT|nr:MAG: hypothetical protein A2161_09830 [Candidatus Schekmanbacteria bacterium RBG_13_48_7]